MDILTNYEHNSDSDLNQSEHPEKNITLDNECCINTIQDKLHYEYPLKRFLEFSTPIFWCVPKVLVYRSIPFINISLIQVFICAFAFFYYMRPSEPFLVEYLVSGKTSSKPVTVEIIVRDIFPLWTYSYPVFQLLIGIICDTLISLKFVIIMGLIAAIISALFVILPYDTLLFVQLSQFTISISIACHQAYFAMIYHSTKKSEYQKLTSYSRFFYLFGNVIGSVFGQLWWLFLCQPNSNSNILSYLFYFTIFFSIICIFIAFIVFPHNSLEYYEDPTPISKVDSNMNNLSQKNKENNKFNDNASNFNWKTSIQNFKQIELESQIQSLNVDSEDNSQLISSTYSNSIKEKKQFNILSVLRNNYYFISSVTYFKEIIHSYTIFNVLFWSLYNIFVVAIHQLAVTYYQTIFKKLYPSLTYNGFMIAIAYIFAAFFTLIPSKLNFIFQRRRIPQYCALLSLCIMSLLLLFLSQSIHLTKLFSPFQSLLIAYTIFIVYHCIFEFLNVISTSQIAESMKFQRFAAIFSFNSVFQNVIQAIVQFAITNIPIISGVFEQYLAFALLLLFLSTFLYSLLGVNMIMKLFKKIKI